MKYYILSAIVFVFGISCFSLTGGDHALLSSELTVIIQGILLTAVCSFTKPRGSIVRGFFSPKV